MRLPLLFTLISSAVIVTSCAPLNPVAALPSYTEPTVATIKAAPAIINSYVQGGDYLAIHAIDGKPVPKASQYTIQPGKRKIYMSSVYKGLSIDQMYYTVNVKPGKSYSLKPVMGEVKETWTPTASEFRSEGFLPLFIDDATGKQLYPPVPKKKRVAPPKPINTAPPVAKPAPQVIQNELLPEKPVPAVGELPTASQPARKRMNWY